MPTYKPVIGQLIVSGATSGVPTSTWRFSRDPSGTPRGLPVNTCPFTITVTFPDQGHFNWSVAHKGQDQQFQGESSYVNGILTMSQDQNNAMVGDVIWKDPNHFQFKVLGGGPSDPGLTFAKSS